MTDLDNLTLMLAANAVGEKIKRYERMLEEGSIYNKKQVNAMLDSYKQASEKLQKAYLNSISNHMGEHKEAC